MIKRISFQYTGKLTYQQVSEKFKQLNQLKQVKMEQAKTIKAIFQGQNGSCGFEHGKTYNLFIDHKPGGNISIFDTDDNGVGKSVERQCEYDTITGFLNNWVLQSQLFESKKPELSKSQKVKNLIGEIKDTDRFIILIENKNELNLAINGDIVNLSKMVLDAMTQQIEFRALINTASAVSQLDC